MVREYRTQQSMLHSEMSDDNVLGHKTTEPGEQVPDVEVTHYLTGRVVAKKGSSGGWMPEDQSR
jgi:hypothetical protein